MGVNLTAVAVLSLVWAATDPNVDIPAQYRIEAHRVAQWAGPADSPAHLPTDVAVDDAGNLYLADGVNHRIIKLTNDGTFAGYIDRFGDQPLVRPIGIDVDSAGNLWIADAGLAAVLVFSADGKPAERIAPPGPGQGHELDLTDVAVSADGLRTYLVDNDNHRLLIRDNRSGAYITLGKPGRSLGQLQWPFMICLNDAGDAFVSETIGARVQKLSAADEWTTSIGRWGVELGQLYRPKGLAIDGAGRIFVGDSTLGIIQVFEPSGRIAGVLTDGQGQPLRFEHPMGMCFDRTGRLYVVEMTAHRVAVVRLVSSGEFRVSGESPSPRRTPSDSKLASPPPVNSQLATRNSKLENARDCAICHLQWLESFQAADGPVLMPAPTHPVQADENTCLGCHDGSVADSRRSVWLEHGHRTGITPPSSMTVPDRLPLDDGRITCRTCHTAHAGNPGETFANANFTRVPNEQSQLCMLCHTEYASGLERGAHPLGTFQMAGVEAATKNPDQPGPQGTRVICQSCHTPHGSRQDHLLRQDTDSNRLCTSCHLQQSPGHWRGDVPRDHPHSPKLSSKAQHQAIADFGTRLGSDQTLICLSCHKLHSAHPGRYLLARPLSGSDFCLSCHPTFDALTDSKHDLRMTAPNERNKLGLTPAQSGPCGTCHSVHQYARQPAPQPHDASGFCLSCHQPGGCGAKQSVTSSHRSVACRVCHDPHNAEHTAFLRYDKNDLCAECHDEISETLLGGHDFTERSDLRNATGRPPDQTGACGFCHDIHRGKGPLMWAATSKQPHQADQLCTGCHTVGAKSPMASMPPLIHPTGPGTTAISDASELPLFDDRGVRDDTGSVACATCHDVHADPEESPGLLRLAENGEEETLCHQCHQQAQTIPWSLHNANLLKHAANSEASTAGECGPCHAVHAVTDATVAKSFSTFWGSTAPHGDADLCLNCHGPDGSATRIERFDHPDLEMKNLPIPNEAGYMPLVDANGKLASIGRLTCVSCHLPHGRGTQDAVAGLTRETVGSIQHRASLPMVRPYATPNLCSSCHGQEGLRRFLHFHDASQRASVLEQDTK